MDKNGSFGTVLSQVHNIKKYTLKPHIVLAVNIKIQSGWYEV